MKIGIMDSGIGGLTVLKECLAQVPNHEYIYYADSLNAPYGSKPPAVVYELTAQVVAKLVELGAEIIVLACNTATAASITRLRSVYDLPIIGMVPAIKPALANANGKRVLVTATELTLQHPYTQQLIDELGGNELIDCKPLTGLVGFAEMGDFERTTVLPYLQEQLAEINPADYSSIVLGCTHFPLFTTYFAELFPESVRFFDGAVGTTKRIKEFATCESQVPSVTFYLSGTLLETGAQYDLIQKILKS